MTNQDLFSPTVKSALYARINRLTPTTPALWGKMNVSQMMAHCQAQLRVAVGDETLPHSFLGKLFGKWAKKKLIEEKPFKKNLPTAPSFLVKTNPEFEKAKAGLITLIERFTEPNITKAPHPFFGVMTMDEWSKGTWKHLDHHLKQFGINE